jgi:hypothetical protein
MSGTNRRLLRNMSMDQEFEKRAERWLKVAMIGTAALLLSLTAALALM